MTKLPETSETSIGITFLVVNLSRLLRQFLSLYLWLFINIKTDELLNHNYINENYIYSKFIERKIINWQGNYRLLAA